MYGTVTDNYVGRYNHVYKRSKKHGLEKPLTLKLQAVVIHIPKNFNILYEMTHRALEHLGVLARDDTWNYEFDTDGVSLSVYDKNGLDIQSVGVDLKQSTLLLYRNRYGTVLNCSEFPRHEKYAVVYNILELTPTEEVEVKTMPVKKYKVNLKSGSRLTMELTDEIYKSFTGVGIIADAKQVIAVDASEIESITPVTEPIVVESDESKNRWMALEVIGFDYKDDPDHVKNFQSIHLRNAVIIRPTKNPKQMHELLDRALHYLYPIDTPEAYVSYQHHRINEYDYKLLVDVKKEQGIPLELFALEDDTIFMYRDLENDLRMSTDGIPHKRNVVWHILELKEEDL